MQLLLLAFYLPRVEDFEYVEFGVGREPTARTAARADDRRHKCAVAHGVGSALLVGPIRELLDCIMKLSQVGGQALRVVSEW